MIRTYIDTGVLIAAARGSGKVAQTALGVISDTQSREFICSDYVKLELIPKPTYFGHAAEVKFYEEFFTTVSAWLPFRVEDLEEAFDEACAAGLGSVDAIHVVVAANSACDEIVTSEKANRAIHRTNRIRVVSIDTE